MTSEVLAADLAAFLRDELETLEEVELVVLLARRGDALWTAEGLERESRLGPGAVKEALDRLRSRKIIDVRADGSYVLAGPAMVDGVGARLALAYAEEPLEIMKRMTAHAVERVRGSAWRAFADAFVLGRGKKGDG